MGITAVLPNMTITQLTDEGNQRWPGVWSSEQSRVLILLLCKRKERKLLEVHGDMVDHDHPVFGLFYRPRETTDLLKEQGFDHRTASFELVEIATSDLGAWLQHLVTNDKWVRSMTTLTPVPAGYQVGMTRGFEKMNIPCFRHPELSPLDTFHLPMPPRSIVGKAFVSIPRLGAEELAKRRGSEAVVRDGTASVSDKYAIAQPTTDGSSEGAVPLPSASQSNTVVSPQQSQQTQQSQQSQQSQQTQQTQQSQQS
ncbi:MAG: hypothetical protein HOC79_09190, partial [Euryarchaeota archaeon]|nr:hypothetical protein [Euryarchaeota archaeon]